MILAFHADPNGCTTSQKKIKSERRPAVNHSPMYSLYHSLLAQHPRQLMPVPCAASTIAQLHRYFEDVVLENNLGALVVESLPTSAERPARDIARIRELDKAARNLFLWVSPQDALSSMVLSRGRENTKSVVFERTDEGQNFE